MILPIFFSSQILDLLLLIQIFQIWISSSLVSLCLKSFELCACTELTRTPFRIYTHCMPSSFCPPCPFHLLSVRVPAMESSWVRHSLDSMCRTKEMLKSTRSGICFCFRNDFDHLCLETVQHGGTNERDVLHRWEDRQVWPRRLRCRFFLDLGCYPAAILGCCIPLRRQWSLLVGFGTIWTS